MQFKHPSPKTSQSREPKVGEVVLIKEDGVNRAFWKIAKVLQLNPSKDGQTRTVQVLTPEHKTFSRSVNLLIPLELAEDPSDTQSENQSQQSSLKVPCPSSAPLKRPKRHAAQAFEDHLRQLIDSNVLSVSALGSVTNAEGISE